MSDLPATSIALDESAAASPDDRALIARRVFRVLMPLAVLSLVVAGVANWLSVREMGEALQGPALVASGVPAPKNVDVSKPAVNMLPTFILTFETITHQAIPGYGKRAAECIYKTLNMDLEAQVGTLVYARVEIFGSKEDAASRLAELQKPYTLERKSEKVNTLIASTGWMPNKGSYTMGWVRGARMIYVKASFADWVPAERRDIIERQGKAIADAIEVYDRTGRQGIKK